MLRETAYTTLSRIAAIVDKTERVNALRQYCQQRQIMGAFFQYVYHPGVTWDLPDGEMPEGTYKPSMLDDYGSFYRNVRKLNNFFVGSPVDPRRKQLNFCNLLEEVHKEDALLLIAAKDKKLPWRKLGRNFCIRALPELFPADLVAEVRTKWDDKKED